MADKFDPYYKWFGIRPEDQPPDFYRLLGIAAFETDLDVISNAADQRMSHLRTLQNGPHAIASQRVLNEVSKARVTLFDADRKLAYDLALRKKIAAAAAAARDATASSAAIAATTSGGRGVAEIEGLETLSSAESLDLLDGNDLDAAVRAAPAAAGTATLTRGHRVAAGNRAASMWISAAFGVVVAVVLVFVLLGKLAGIDPLGLFPPGDVVAENDEEGDDSPSSNRAASDPVAPSGNGGKAKETAPSPGPKENAGGKSPLAAKGGGDTAAGTPTGDIVEPSRVNDARVVDPFEDFPAFASLPPVTETAPHALVALGGSPSVIVEDLSLVASAAALEVGRSFDIVAIPGASAPKWRVRLRGEGEDGASAPAIALADVWFDGGAAQFQWHASAAAAPVSAQLQNCLIKFRASGKERLLALRAPDVRPALVLDLSTPANLVEIPVDAPPNAESLVLEIGPIDALPWEAAFENDRRRVPFQSPRRDKVIVLLGALDDENRPEISVEPQALRTGLHLRISPRVVNAESEFSLSLSQVAEIKKNYGVRKIRIDKQWSELRQRTAALRKQVENIEKQLSTFPPQRALLQRELSRITVQLGADAAAFDKVDADKAEIDEMLDTMPAVEELIAELHKKAKLPFRVFATVDLPQGESVEFDIVRAPE